MTYASITKHFSSSQINSVIDIRPTTGASATRSTPPFKRDCRCKCCTLGCFRGFPRRSRLGAGICPSSRLDDGVPRAHVLARPHELLDHLAAFSEGRLWELVTGTSTRPPVIQVCGLRRAVCERVRVRVQLAERVSRLGSWVASLPAQADMSALFSHSHRLVPHFTPTFECIC